MAQKTAVNKKCDPKPFSYKKTPPPSRPPPPPPSNTGGPNKISEIVSWKLLKKNPSGMLIWAIFGGACVMDAFYYRHFLLKKEYQVDHKKRMWNERTEMLEKPVKMKLYYPSKKLSEPEVFLPLLDIYKRMDKAEAERLKRIEDCMRAANKFGNNKNDD
ncbi:Hypothetical protein CINCED_3A012137 [Cinara cedri]|uniref:Uncharacterized protein n=1 Tax=Cinara cedri TaxID=506608 RepID=A0A5E4M163_9HEMI|nr:Hypothetical protein CINCED_3A012137 [Cinara cedri]